MIGSDLVGTITWVVGIILIVGAVPTYLIYTVRVAKGRRGPRAAYLFLVTLVSLIVVLLAVEELATAAGTAAVGRGSNDCLKNASARLQAQGPPPAPIRPAITLPPLPTPPPLPAFTIPPGLIPRLTALPFSTPFPTAPSNLQLGCLARGALPSAGSLATHGGVIGLIAAAVLTFHARAAKRLVDEEESDG